MLWFLFGLAVGYVIFRKRRGAAPLQEVTGPVVVPQAAPPAPPSTPRPHPQPHSQPQPSSVPVAPQTRESDPPLERSFEEVYGSLDCDGGKCSPNDTCNEFERLFCQKVMKKIFTKPGQFTPQYTIPLEGKVRKVDFAFLTADNRKVAIECDGYHTHAKKASLDDFVEGLHRSNALVADGWQVLRFSLHDCHKHPELCIAELKRFAGDVEKVYNPICIFCDVIIPPAEVKSAIPILKSNGILYSPRRKAWYFPAGWDTAWLKRDWTVVPRMACRKFDCQQWDKRKRDAACPGTARYYFKDDKEFCYCDCDVEGNNFSLKFVRGILHRPPRR